MLMGARGYLSRRYSYAGGGVTAVPDHVISAYREAGHARTVHTGQRQ